MITNIVSEKTINQTDFSLVKKHLRVSHNYDDVYIFHLIRTAENVVESMTNRSIRPKTYILLLEHEDLKKGDIEIPYPPLLSIVSVKYQDSQGNLHAYTDYEVEDRCEPAILSLRDIPDDLSKRFPFEITYDAGYDGLSYIPENLKHAIFYLITSLYEKREYVSEKKTYEDDRTLRALLMPHKVVVL